MPIHTHKDNEWFKAWFDSSYYHLLYQHRDHAEAEAFITTLLQHLKFPKNSKVLDLACGAGRHALFLQKKGLNVMGVDLAANSIETAKKHENEYLSFAVHDMRMPLKENYFDAVFSFFTSFGYFESEQEHLQTLQNVHNNLKKDGIFVMDFFNAQKVKAGLVPKEEKTIDAVEFKIKRYIRHKTVFKRIEFQTPGGQNFWFRERVRLFTKPELTDLFSRAGLSIQSIYGDYSLGAFHADSSPRLIIFAKKT